MKTGSPAFEKVVRSAGRCVCEYRLITDGDSILVGLSGGKDSFTLLETLLELQKRAPVNFTITGAAFDPGFPGFPLGEIAGYCRKRGVPFASTGLSIPDILAERPSRKPPCVLCSRLRRGKLYGLARELGCGKLALGQHLDDLLASFLMSALRGGGLTTMAPLAHADAPDGCTVIRPLALTDEETIRAAAAEFDVPTDCRCPYHEALAASGDRARAGRLLQLLEKEFPGARSGLTASLARVEIRHLLDKRYLPNDGRF